MLLLFKTWHWLYNFWDVIIITLWMIIQKKKEGDRYEKETNHSKTVGNNYASYIITYS